ncbi:MAG: insulinase family protein, partial [Pedobacter sp.]
MLNKNFKVIASLVISLSALTGCQNMIKEGMNKSDVVNEKLSIPYEKYTLANGLQVILHVDKSDPIVSTAILYHVGSNREEKGRTGFAHLFEHMLFQKSENVGEDQYFKTIQNAGGTLNGFTWNDGTMYFESVPNDALETILWLESDRMGYFINTVDQASFDNQKDVVQNEKRQRVDNVPYGHTEYIISKNIYPANHPYNWQVIGELEDIMSADLSDVKNFYKRYYSPNNATLVVAGDFSIAEGKKLVEKYFGEIKKGESVSSLKPMNVTLNETKKLYHEDNFATLPELTLTWPTVENYNKDAYALTFLANLLGDSKKSPLYKVLV